MGFLDSLTENLGRNVSGFVHELERQLAASVMRRIEIARRRFMRKIAATLFLFFAVIFLAISAIYFLVEYLALSKTLAFLIIGIIMLVIGLIVKISN